MPDRAVDFVAAALNRIDRADAAMDDGVPDRAKHERSLAHVYAVLATRRPLESVEQVEGSDQAECGQRGEDRR